MIEALTKLEQADGVATLILDREAKRKALSRALRHELVAPTAPPKPTRWGSSTGSTSRKRS